MLINLGVEICGDPLTWDHVIPFVQKFDILDKDDSNLLTKADLQEIARMEAAELQQQTSPGDGANINGIAVLSPVSVDYVQAFKD